MTLKKATALAVVALGAALAQGAADIPAGFPEPVCAPLGAVKYPARDDAATIVKMIAETKAAGRREVVIPQKNPKHADGLWIIEQAIRVPSGTRIIIDGARLVLADRVFCNVFQNEHARSKDRGKLSAEDRDIEIVGRNGATLDGGNYNGWGERSLPWKRGMFYADAEHREALAKAGKTLEDNSFVYFHNVKGFRVEGLKLRHQRRWACTFSYCSEGLIRDIRFEADISWVSEDGLDHRPNRVPGLGDNLYVKNGDGIDLRQGCNNIRVENLSGWSEDDMLALTNLGPFARDGVEGKSPDIHHVTVRNIRGATFLWFNLIRLLCADGTRIHDIDIDGVREECEPRMPWRGCVSAVMINDQSTEFYKVRQAVMGEVKDIVIRNVETAAAQPLHLFGPIENLTVENLHLRPGAVCAIGSWKEAEFKNVRVSHVTADESVKLGPVLRIPVAKGEIAIDDVRLAEAAGVVCTSGDVKVKLSNIRIDRLTGPERATEDPVCRPAYPVLPEYVDLSVGL